MERDQIDSLSISRKRERIKFTLANDLIMEGTIRMSAPLFNLIKFWCVMSRLRGSITLVGAGEGKMG